MQAINLLTSIKDEELRHKPAVLASLLTLQEQQQNLAGAIATVQEGLQWWQNSMTAEPPQKTATVSWLRQQMVQLQLKAGQERRNMYCFQRCLHHVECMIHLTIYHIYPMAG